LIAIVEIAATDGTLYFALEQGDVVIAIGRIDTGDNLAAVKAEYPKKQIGIIFKHAQQ
jgi:hypothetical protein